MAKNMKIRFAEEKELPRVNELRRQVNDIHTEGEPGIFKPGFTAELQNYIYEIRNDPEQEIVVADCDGTICGFAVLHHIRRPENPVMFERDYMDIDEFGVDKEWRRQGVASAMISFIRDYVKEKGFRRL